MGSEMCIRDRPTADFIKILKVSDFYIGFYYGGQKTALRNTNISKIHSLFIKLAVDQKHLKLGMVTSWAISIAHKNILATATCLEGVNFLTAAVERVYSLIHLAVTGRKLTLLCF